jgi:hypothetical protein
MVRHPVRPGNPAREFQLMKELLCNRKSCFCVCVCSRGIYRAAARFEVNKNKFAAVWLLLIITLDGCCCCRYIQRGVYMLYLVVGLLLAPKVAAVL